MTLRKKSLTQLYLYKLYRLKKKSMFYFIYPFLYQPHSLPYLPILLGHNTNPCDQESRTGR